MASNPLSEPLSHSGWAAQAHLLGKVASQRRVPAAVCRSLSLMHLLGEHHSSQARVSSPHYLGGSMGKILLSGHIAKGWGRCGRPTEELSQLITWLTSTSSQGSLLLNLLTKSLELNCFVEFQLRYAQAMCLGLTSPCLTFTTVQW